MVNELSSLGLQPSVLQELLDQGDNKGTTLSERLNSDGLPTLETTKTKAPSFPKIVYEFSTASNSIEPRLRLWVKGSRNKELGLSTSSLGEPDHESLEAATQIISPKCVLVTSSW